MIKPVSYAELLEARELIAEYAQECSIPEIGPIDPQPQMYAAMERSGVMQCFAAVRPINDPANDGSIMGFASVLTTVLPHYGRKVATIESLFVSKKVRRLGVGFNLLRTVERYAKKSGCAGILYSAPVGGQLERVLDASRKYRCTNSIFYRSFQ